MRDLTDWPHALSGVSFYLKMEKEPLSETSYILFTRVMGTV